jgi:Ca-activated chloride channel family protein
MDEAGKLRAIHAISRIKSMGSTNLSGGWFRGAEHVAAFMNGGARTRNHVVLLSDGHANEGILDPEVLSRHADELRQRGLLTSTVGIGDGYSPVQLRALAEHGGGRMHDDERPQEIVEIVLAELEQVSATVAENVRVDVTLPAGDEAEVLGDYPTLRENGRLVSAIGSMIASGTRSMALRLRIPAAETGTAIEFIASVRWREPGADEDRASAPVAVALALTVGARAATGRRDPLVSVVVARLWQSWVMLRVGPLNREARAFLDREIKPFREYARELPEGAELLQQLEEVRRYMDHTWDERGLKEVELAHYKRSRGEADLRQACRPDWSAFVGRKPGSSS